MHDVAFVFAGFFVGLVVGLTGVGGGSLMTPILIFFFGVKPYLAVGTDLLFAAFTKLGGTVRLARARVIDWRIVLNLSAGSIPAALITLFILHHIANVPTTPRHWSLPLLLGAVVGTLVTLTSVGAGAIGVSVLLIVYPLLPLPRIVAADIAYAVPLTLVAGLGHASLGSVDWPLLAKLLAGSLPGIWLGSHLMHRINERVIRSALSVLLAWAGLKLIAI